MVVKSTSIFNSNDGTFKVVEFVFGLVPRHISPAKKPSERGAQA